MDLTERALPQNLEAERAVLGAILVDNNGLNQVAQIVVPADFYREAHRRIYQCMLDLSERNAPIDLLSLREELAQTNSLDVVGGPAYLARLLDGVPRASNVEYYGSLIKEKSTARRVIAAASVIMTDAFDGAEPGRLLSRSEQAILDVAGVRQQGSFASMNELAQVATTSIQDAYETQQLVRGVPTGYAALDVLTSGLQKGDLIIVAARPSAGKTSIALNMAQYAALRGRTVAVFSMEMSKEQLFMRMLSSEAAVNSNRLRTGFLRASDFERIPPAMARLAEARLKIDDTSGLTTTELRAKARRLLAEEKVLDMIIVDYIQLMQGSGRVGENRTQELSAISRSLKGIARELDVPLVALSQLSRAPEARTDHRPQLSDLRECLIGDTLVTDATSGQRVRLDRLVPGTKILGLSTDQRVVAGTVADVWRTGRRQVVKVTTKTGRSIVATENHPVLTDIGWRTVAQLSSGSRIAVAFRAPAGATELAQEERDLCRLLTWATSDVVWDPVASIVSAGEADVYDLRVEGTGCLLANDGMVVHNSGAIEQDADVVLMIYREDQYKADAEPDIAEIIIAKQRNGPTETVRLAFLKDRTRFIDYAEE